MGFRCGIVGLPNVGKSTLFNALTRASVQAENYPFCTIKPNTGMVEVPDPRLHTIAGLVKPARVVPAVIEFVDIAGLVAGASRGEGLGNRFLAQIREVDAIAHVVRCFEDTDVTHVADRVDPLADIQTVEIELALADLATIEGALYRTEKAAKNGDKEQRRLMELFQRVHEWLDTGSAVRNMALDQADRFEVKALCLLTNKPVVYIANVGEEDSSDNTRIETLRSHAEPGGAEIVLVSARIEQEIAALDDLDRTAFLEDLGLEEPGLNRVIRAGYRLLGLQTFFTAAEKEAKAWTVRSGISAAQAAGVIHTDFERGFIRAETIAYDDFVRLGGEQGAREAGRLRLEGKEYVLTDGDIMNFRFNV
ncbi:MAG: redox-regulated ATPase YchF [Arenicellales bacterium]|jgi:hypothetical protein|nr:redox-regulated ATPase YchF [Acidiferrobacteraceae bacterium]MDP6137765.1 redox-regulated ATPase YchF [Arenicellales bacterium]HCF73404.1 redox-regulated ATPase YchF [Gammaproteobacteria bacterium]MDP6392346.1 redox-regulated ATPase YchF [Arenicellales bacterium]MDP7220930.1 redox-regulated ATPase YchF [Arenicellales bacterium]|tara:strand:+ start:2544 stop:3635 length:1092 start_codon:yes stop_codon:yes gene_type:complete